MFGTLSILRYLLAPHARYTYRAVPQTYSTSLITFSFIYGCSALLLCGGLFFVRVLFWGDREPFGILGIAVGLLVLVSSMVSTTSSVYHAIRREQVVHTWDLLLLLPYPREQVILRTAAQSYKPFTALISLALVAIAARQLANFQFRPLFLLYQLLALEWLQLTAFHVAGGLMLANVRQVGPAGPLLLSFSVIMIRTVGGLAVALLFSLPTNAALLVGPLSITLTTTSVFIRAAIALLYLLLLESAVRFLFAYAVARAGENG